MRVVEELMCTPIVGECGQIDLGRLNGNWGCNVREFDKSRSMRNGSLLTRKWIRLKGERHG